MAQIFRSNSARCDIKLISYCPSSSIKSIKHHLSLNASAPSRCRDFCLTGGSFNLNTGDIISQIARVRPLPFGLGSCLARTHKQCALAHCVWALPRKTLSFRLQGEDVLTRAIISNLILQFSHGIWTKYSASVKKMFLVVCNLDLLYYLSEY